MLPRPLGLSASPALLCVALVLAAFVPAVAYADETADSPPIFVGFRYTASAASCPSEGRAFSLVHRRSQRVLRAEDDSAELLLAMEVRAEGKGYRGVLTVSRAGQGEERRAMTGSLCGEVVEALALTAALSIDPDATLTLDPAEDDQAEVATEPEPPGDEIPDPASKSHESPSPVEPARVSVGPLFSLARILDDSPHLGVGAVISLSKQSDAVWFPLEFRLSLESLFETKRGDAPRILTSIFSSRLSYCPLRVGASTAILLCPFSELAVIAARADGYEDAEQVDRSYFALGTELWLRTRPTRHVELSFVPGLAVPLTVRKFAVQPNEEVVVSTVDLAWSVSLIAAYRF